MRIVRSWLFATAALASTHAAAQTLSQPAQPAAVTAIPGVVFAGTLDGVMRACAADDGRILCQDSSTREYTAVNGLTAKGGALNRPGPVVANGMFFMNSGYSAIGGDGPGNVLLAFGVD